MKYDPHKSGAQYLEDLATSYWYASALFTALDSGLFDVLRENSELSAEDAATYDRMEADIVNLGKEVERQSRAVTVFELEAEPAGTGTACPPDPAAGNEQPARDYRIHVHCSKGTYVRTLCHDIGAALGCGGCMAALVRTRAGRYSLRQAYTMEQILSAPNPEALLLPIDSLFADRPFCKLNEAGEQKLRNGASLRTGKLADGEYRVYGPSGDFLALCAVTAGELRTIKSFFSV